MPETLSMLRVGLVQLQEVLLPPEVSAVFLIPMGRLNNQTRVELQEGEGKYRVHLMHSKQMVAIRVVAQMVYNRVVPLVGKTVTLLVVQVATILDLQVPNRDLMDTMPTLKMVPIPAKVEDLPAAMTIQIT